MISNKVNINTFQNRYSVNNKNDIKAGNTQNKELSPVCPDNEKKLRPSLESLQAVSLTKLSFGGKISLELSPEIKQKLTPEERQLLTKKDLFQSGGDNSLENSLAQVLNRVQRNKKFGVGSFHAFIGCTEKDFKEKYVPLLEKVFDVDKAYEVECVNDVPDEGTRQLDDGKHYRIGINSCMKGFADSIFNSENSTSLITVSGILDSQHKTGALYAGQPGLHISYTQQMKQYAPDERYQRNDSGKVAAVFTNIDTSYPDKDALKEGFKQTIMCNANFSDQAIWVGENPVKN